MLEGETGTAKDGRGEVTGQYAGPVSRLAAFVLDSIFIWLAFILFMFGLDVVLNIFFQVDITRSWQQTVGGVPYSWEEVVPGCDRDPCQWEVFLQACKEIGYDGYLSHEQCSPIIVKGHKLGDLDEIDRRYVAAHAFFKDLLIKLDCHTGHIE